MLLVHLKKTIGEFQDEGLGLSRGGLTSKIHCLSDQFGNPVDLLLTGGQVHDSKCAQALLHNKKANFVIADRAYDSQETLCEILAFSCVLGIKGV